MSLMRLELKAIIIAVITLFGIGCAHQDGSTKDNQQTTSSAVSSSKSSKMMRFAFYYPVVMVNGKRASKQEKQENEETLGIEAAYPENSVNDITVTIGGGELAERTLYGKIKVFQASQFAIGNLVQVAQDASDVYESIWRQGYGEMTIRERMVEANRVEDNKNTSGTVVAQLVLGTKKDDRKVEFRFSANSGAQIDGKLAPVSFSLAENSQQTMKLALDEGAVQLQGVLEAYAQTPYTQHAPVWITFDEQTKDYLRGRGSKAELALCIPTSSQENMESGDTVVKFLGPQDTPARVASKYGTLVGLLKVQRIN